ncbi:hypothetical protein JB92DRAFT_2828337 [Gautieria morchelliformis]|nr:hypothetical protein JB92DRAFT_2828337 [Gautieria morchelliformis]
MHPVAFQPSKFTVYRHEVTQTLRLSPIPAEKVVVELPGHCGTRIKPGPSLNSMQRVMHPILTARILLTLRQAITLDRGTRAVTAGALEDNETSFHMSSTAQLFKCVLAARVKAEVSDVLNFWAVREMKKCDDIDGVVRIREGRRRSERETETEHDTQLARDETLLLIQIMDISVPLTPASSRLEDVRDQ